MLDIIPDAGQMTALVGESLYEVWNSLRTLIAEHYDKDYHGANVRGGSGGVAGKTMVGSSRMPSSIHSTDGTTYYLRQNLGYGAEYVASDDSSDVIQITNVYSRTDSEMDTNAGHFYFY